MKNDAIIRRDSYLQMIQNFKIGLLKFIISERLPAALITLYTTYNIQAKAWKDMPNTTPTVPTIILGEAALLPLTIVLYMSLKKSLRGVIDFGKSSIDLGKTVIKNVQQGTMIQNTQSSIYGMAKDTIHSVEEMPHKIKQQITPIRTVLTLATSATLLLIISPAILTDPDTSNTEACLVILNTVIISAITSSTLESVINNSSKIITYPWNAIKSLLLSSPEEITQTGQQQERANSYNS